MNSKFRKRSYSKPIIKELNSMWLGYDLKINVEHTYSMSFKRFVSLSGYNSKKNTLEEELTQHCKKYGILKIYFSEVIEKRDAEDVIEVSYPIYSLLKKAHRENYVLLLRNFQYSMLSTGYTAYDLLGKQVQLTIEDYLFQKTDQAVLYYDDFFEIK